MLVVVLRSAVGVQPGAESDRQLLLELHLEAIDVTVGRGDLGLRLANRPLVPVEQWQRNPNGDVGQGFLDQRVILDARRHFVIGTPPSVFQFQLPSGPLTSRDRRRQLRALGQ